MRTLLLSLVLLATSPALLGAAAPWCAAVRITLAGQRRVCGSGTVVWTQEGRSHVLTCAHLWCREDGRAELHLDRALLAAPVTVDVEFSPGGQTSRMRPYRGRLTHISTRRDLALVELEAGPLPHVCHVMPAGARVGQQCISAGYDRSRVPTVVAWAHRLGPGSDVEQLTREWAVPGRSGGPLIDAATKRLVGVVHGARWESMPGGRERLGSRRGTYASHQSVLQFLAEARRGLTRVGGTSGAPAQRYDPRASPVMPRVAPWKRPGVSAPPRKAEGRAAPACPT